MSVFFQLKFEILTTEERLKLISQKQCQKRHAPGREKKYKYFKVLSSIIYLRNRNCRENLGEFESLCEPKPQATVYISSYLQIRPNSLEFSISFIK